MSIHTAINTDIDTSGIITLLDRVYPRLSLQEPAGPDRGGEDEANFTLSWLAAEELDPQPERRAFLDACFADLQRWVREDCVNGYQPIQEAHHGTEPFLLFLPRYARLPGVDKEAIAALVCKAADYILNRVPGQGQWFDFENMRFVSLDLGSERVGDRDIWKIETADHLRFIHIALNAYELSSDQAYADWAHAYAVKRASLINDWPDDQPLPWAWWHDGTGIFGGVGDGRSDNLLAIKMHVDGDDLAGVENLLASGVMQAFAGAYTIKEDDALARAAARIACSIAPGISDPYHDPAACALRYYRNYFSNNVHYQSVDEIISKAVAQWTMDVPDQHLVFPAQAKRVDHGVGRRFDMMRWYEADGEFLKPTTQACTAARVLAAEITGDQDHLAAAAVLAEKRLAVALRGLRCGREHSDMGSSIAACGAGHGRCWGTGNVTGLFDALSGYKTVPQL